MRSLPSRLSLAECHKAIAIRAGSDRAAGGLASCPYRRPERSPRIAGLFTLVTGMGLYVASVYGDGFGREYATGKPVSAPAISTNCC